MTSKKKIVILGFALIKVATPKWHKAQTYVIPRPISYHIFRFYDESDTRGESW